jgi:hypothetical protein
LCLSDSDRKHTLLFTIRFLQSQVIQMVNKISVLTLDSVNRFEAAGVKETPQAISPKVRLLLQSFVFL